MSFTATPASMLPITRVFTLKVTALGIEDLDEAEIERLLAVAVSERINEPTTVDADELPF